MMKALSSSQILPGVVAIVLLTLVLVPATADAKGGPPKEDICHLDKDPGTFKIINVAVPAVPAHLAHGDFPPLTFYPDLDGDGFGAGAAVEGCVVPPGFVDNDDDCNDTDPAVNPDAEEVCNAVDDNCDGDVDEGLTFDDDDDGFTSLDSCEGSRDDCDDTDPAVNPGEAEVCNGIDDNCSGTADEGLDFDDDGDGFNSLDSCDSPVDCDDGDADVNPGADEVCGDGVDNDCDGDIDDSDDDCPDNTAPVAVDDDFLASATIVCVLPTCGGERDCTLNAPAGTLTANDFDNEGDTFDAVIDGDITDVGWACNADHICTTDSGFVGTGSTLTVNADGSFDLTYRTTQNFVIGGPADVVIVEFLYNVVEDATPDMFQSSMPARVMIKAFTDQSCP